MSSSNSVKYPYKVDYNDHFETPEVAYRDILPLLDAVDNGSNKQNPNRARHVIYDPYYCNGRTKRIIQSFGFANMKHEKRDFYKDIEKNQVPKYHTLLTNPPYSDDHKERCVNYAVEQLTASKKAFFILMPNYVACRNHFRSAISGVEENIFFVIPGTSTPYEYDHPDGTGKADCPFESIWFCGAPSEKLQTAKNAFRETHGNPESPRLASSLKELISIGAVPTLKRKNLRQRLKAKRKIQEAQNAGGSSAAPSQSAQQSKKKNDQNVTVTQNARQGRKRKSKYRDESGARIKKRF